MDRTMGATQFILILVAEVLAVSLFVAAVLLLRNRKLRRLVNKLQERVRELSAQLKKTRQAPPPPAAREESYNDKLNRQIELTKDYHHSLGTRQEIALDLDPDSPLPRRTAALRHVFLIAEKEATARTDTVNWDFLASRYRQLLTFHQDYQTPPDNAADEAAQQLKEELVQAKKRINNLERFKAMYMELEERWDRCKDKATEHYIELKSMAAKTEDKEGFQRLLDNYHSTYSDIGVLIEQGFTETIASVMANNPEDHLQEIRRLRNMAADQHKIIAQLQTQLQSAISKEEKMQVVEHLQTELQKQARFLQESETCIKLMEDELATSKAEAKQLLERLEQMQRLKAEFKELQSSANLHEQVVDSLKQENRRLAKKVKLMQESPPEDNQEIRTLRKELTTLQGKYNDLEESFLNLKLKE
jgi:DNA repair exonuclease SbcCD ATPase subunit